MSDEALALNEENDIRRPMRGRPPNVSKLSNQAEMSNEEDSRARAKRLAEEIRAQREGREDDGVDEFRAPEAPPGWAYQWKVKTVFNDEQTAHQNNLQRNGWTPVPVSRHPDFLPIGRKGNTIEHKGMILMELPEELVNDARNREKRIADMQVNQKAGHLDAAPGTMLAEQTGKTKAKLSRSYAAIPIPD